MTDRERRTPPRLLAISDGRLDLERVRRPEFSRWLAALDRVGAALQLREKSLTDAALLELAKHVRRHFEGLLLVNGRPDIALASEADGAHLTSTSAPVGQIVRSYSDALLLGVSTHSADEVEAAAAAGVDYVVFGPVFETPSKAGLGAPHGLDALRELCRATEVPVLAIGGLDAGRAVQALDQGAWGVAAIRAFERPETFVSALDR